jgi:hypothetical protein
VDELKAECAAEAALLDATVAVPCAAKLDPAVFAQWHAMLDRVNAFVQRPYPIFGGVAWTGPFIAEGEGIKADLRPWYDRFRAAGCANVPAPPAAPPPSPASALASFLKSPALLLLAGWLLLREVKR